MWWLWLVCVCGACGARGAAGERDALLAALAAAGKARAALCAGGAACAGVVWSRHWLLVRASCIDRRALAPARLLLHTEPKYCASYVAKTDLKGPGPVMARFLHPRYYTLLSDDATGRWAKSPQPAPAQPDQFDAALILLAEAAAVPPTANHSRAYAAIPSSLVAWLRSTTAAYPGAGDAPELDPSMYLASSPMRLLLYTALLPTAALLLLSVLLLRRPAARVPYAVLDDDEVADKIVDEIADEIADEFDERIDYEIPAALRAIV